MPRIKPRHRPIQRISRPGKWFGWGPQEQDGISGVRFPRELMVPQRGTLVETWYSHGSRDLVEGFHDLNSLESPPIIPTSISRLMLGTGPTAISLLSLDTVTDVPFTNDLGYFVGGLERVTEWSTLAVSGYVREPAGFGYPEGTEEATLVPVYRLHAPGSGDYLFTASASERTAALAGAYTDDQGIGFYGFATGAHNRTPIYRALSGAGYHWYSTDAIEYAILPASFTRQGIIAYVLTGAEGTVAN